MADFVKMMLDGVGEMTRKVLGKEETKEIVMFSEQSNSHDLYTVITQYVEEHRFCEAEDLLYEEIDKGFTEGKYLAGVEFYEMLKAIDEEVLIAHNFSLKEVEDGQKELNRYKELHGGELVYSEPKEPRPKPKKKKKK